MSKYIVKPVVCDYGIFIVDDLNNEELVEICNSQANANTICDIFNADLMKDGAYTIWKDQQIADLEQQLALTEKALELCAKKLLSIYCSDYCGDTANCGKTECEFEQKCSSNYFKTKAKEIMKSE